MRKTRIVVPALLSGFAVSAAAQDLTWRKDIAPIVKKGCAERATNLRTIKTWLGEGARNLNRFKERQGVPGITKEQIEKAKARY